MFVIKLFQWDTLRLGITISVCGIIGVCFLLSFPVVLHVISDVDLVLVGLAFMVSSCLCLNQMFFPTLSEDQVYVGLLLMFAIGYPIGHTALIGLFSKISKSGPQGRMMGIFGSVGSLARIIFPISSGVAVQYFGFAWIFSLASILLCAAIIVVLWNRKALLRYMKNHEPFSDQFTN